MSELGPVLAGCRILVTAQRRAEEQRARLAAEATTQHLARLLAVTAALAQATTREEDPIAVSEV